MLNKTILLTLTLILMRGCYAYASIDLDRWADAIYKAENSINHPYGIMHKDCNKNTPDVCRKICKNTVYNTLVKYRSTRCKSGESDLNCLARRYAPIGVDNDPNNLNKNWKRNVLWFLNH